MNTRYPTPEITRLASKMRGADAKLKTWRSLPQPHDMSDAEYAHSMDTAEKAAKFARLAFEAADQAYTDQLKRQHAQVAS